MKALSCAVRVSCVSGSTQAEAKTAVYCCRIYSRLQIDQNADEKSMTLRPIRSAATRPALAQPEAAWVVGPAFHANGRSLADLGPHRSC